MVNRSSFRNLHFNNFKLITWLQIFIIAIAPNFIFYQEANATTVGAEGWSVSKRLVQGATTFYDGTKNIVLNGKNYAAKGTAAVTPAASQVAKMIVRTGAALAVTVAVQELIGAVDFVMDPANNRVVYYPPASDPSSPQYEYYYKTTSSYNSKFGIGLDRFAACEQLRTFLPTSMGYISLHYARMKQYPDYCYFSKNNDTTAYQYGSVSRVKNPAYNPSAPKEEKYLPYDAVAAQIVSDAVAEKADAKSYVSSVADTALEDEQRQIVPATDVIQQLTSSQAIPTTGTGTGTAVPAPTTGDPATGDPTAEPKPYDITLNFPVFCDWAPMVCQAAQVAINFPTTVGGYWNTFNKWMNEQATDTSDPKPEIKELQLNFDDGNRVTFDQTCPQPQPIELTFMGVSQSASFSYEPLCNFMTMIRPFVIGSAYLIGAYIVMGLSRGNSE